jgi:hypothetical protein
LLRDSRTISGISEIYPNRDDLCTALAENFVEFETFAGGSPEFFAPLGGPRFLSLAEFVEETELQLRSARLALRFEDFMIDPIKELSKILRVMSIDRECGGLSASRRNPAHTPTWPSREKSRNSTTSSVH